MNVFGRCCSVFNEASDNRFLVFLQFRGLFVRNFTEVESSRLEGRFHADGLDCVSWGHVSGNQAQGGGYRDSDCAYGFWKFRHKMSISFSQIPNIPSIAGLQTRLSWNCRR